MASSEAEAEVEVEVEVESSLEASASASDAEEEHNMSRPSGETGKRKRKPHVEKVGTPISSIVVGQDFAGVVKSVQPFGAFVDFGGQVDGMVHISRLSDGFVSDVAAVVKVGDEVKGRVVSVDVEKKQVGLSMKSEGMDNEGGGGEGGNDARR